MPSHERPNSIKFLTNVMRSFFFTLMIFYFSVNTSLGQVSKPDTSDHYQQLEIRYQKTKDSLSLINHFSPVVSSVILNYKQLEIDFFNSIMSTNKYRDENGKLKDLPIRSTYLYNSIQLTYGISKKTRWNIGFDISAKTVRIDADPNSSIFKIFNSGIDGFNNEYANAFTSFGPRIRWKPFRDNYHFTLQTNIQIPFNLNSEKEDILGSMQTIIGTQLIYNAPAGKRFFLFPQVALQYGFRNDKNQLIFYTPISCYIGYYIPKKLILFSFFNYVPIFRKNESWSFTQYTFQLGAGIQYHITKDVFINIYYAKDLAGKNFSYFDNYSIGFSYILN